MSCTYTIYLIHRTRHNHCHMSTQSLRVTKPTSVMISGCKCAICLLLALLLISVAQCMMVEVEPGVVK